MKKTVYGFLFLWLLAGMAANTWAQAPAWQALVTLPPGSMGSTTVAKVAVAANGDVVLLGSVYGRAQIGQFTLTATTTRPYFLAKWRPATGSFVWAVTVGGGVPKGLALSGTAIYVAGEFFGPTLSIGPATLVNQGIQGNNEEGYVAKFVDTGTSAVFAWAQAISGDNNEFVGGLAVQGSDVYVCGTSMSTSLTIGGTTRTHVGRGLYVAKLHDPGAAPALVWCQEGGPPSEMWGRGLAVQGDAVYVAGYFGTRATATIGPFTLANAYVGTVDAFVAKLTDAGSTVRVSWAVRAGGLGADQASAVAVAGNRVYVAGEFGMPQASFGGFTLTNANTGQHPFVSKDVFMARLSDLGSSATVDWALGAGGPQNEEVGTLVAAGSSVYLVGAFESRVASFGSTTLTNTSTPGTYASYDIFVARYDSVSGGGALGWAVQAGGTGGDFARSATLTGGQLVVAGTINPPATFGTLAVSGPVATVGFLATLPAGLLPTAQARAAERGLLAVYPNPASTTATVRLPAVPGAPAATLTLLDALGRPVRTQPVPLPAATAEVPLTGLARGLYQVRVQAGGQTLSRPLVVE